jgi:hypothetical protein
MFFVAMFFVAMFFVAMFFVAMWGGTAQRDAASSATKTFSRSIDWLTLRLNDLVVSFEIDLRT